MTNTNLVTIILTDHIDKIILNNLDKTILKDSSTYFDKLLTNFKEQYDNEILIEVPVGCCYAMCDIIISFYEPTHYSTAYMKCIDFLGGTINNNMVDQLVIDNDNFELFLNMFKTNNYNNYDDKCVNYIIKKIPNDYDVDRLDKLLVKKIIDMNPDILTAGYADGRIMLVNMDHETKFEILYEHHDCVTCLSYSLDKQILVSGSDDYFIRIRHMDIAKINKTFKCGRRIHRICLSPNNKLVAWGDLFNNFFILDIDTGNHAIF